MIKRIFLQVKDALAHEKKNPPVKRDPGELEFLPSAIEILETPPSKFSRLLMFILCAILMTTIVFAWFSFIDIDATAEGKIIPTGQVKTIQSLIIGRVEAIYVREGQFVNKNDLLLKLDPTESETDLHQVQASLLTHELNAARLQALLDAIVNGATPELRHWLEQHPDTLSGPPSTEQWQLQQQQLQSDYDYFVSGDQAMAEMHTQKRAATVAIQAEITRLSTLKPLHEENEASVKKLMSQGHVSKIEWLSIKEKQLDTSQKLIVETSRLSESRAAESAVLSERRKFQQEFVHARRNSLNEYKEKIADLEMTITKARERDENCYLKAPETGVIQQLQVHTIGGVVQPAEKLMILVPENTELQVEAMIPNKDIGFVKTGMKVDIKIETFPYTFYGYLDGVVEYISKDAIDIPERGLVYSSLIKLAKQTVKVNEKDEPLQIGMSVTADINTGERRLLDFFIEPLLRYKDASLNVR